MKQSNKKITTNSNKKGYFHAVFAEMTLHGEEREELV